MVYALLGPLVARHPRRIPATPGRASSTTSTSPARASTASRSAWSRPTCSTSCCSACWRRASASGSFFIDIATALAGRFAGGPAKVVDLRLGAVRHDLGLVDRQHGDGRLAHHPDDDPHRLSAPLRRRRRGGGRDRRPDHAADHGRRGVPDGRVSERCPTRRSSSPRSCRPSCISSACSCQVHFEAKKLGLRGLTADELPKLARSRAARLADVDPAVVLLIVLFSGFTPYLAAFWGITACIVLGLTNRNPRHRRRLAGGDRRRGRLPASSPSGRRTARRSSAPASPSRAYYVLRDADGRARLDRHRRRLRDRRQVRDQRRRGGGDRRHHHRRRDADRRRLQAVGHHHQRGAAIWPASRGAFLPAMPVRRRRR